MQSGFKGYDKIRVGFILNLSGGWLGGVNYFRNLLNLIHSYKEFNIEPVVFLPYVMEERLLQGFPDVEFVRVAGMDRYTLSWILNKAITKMFQKEIYWEYMVKKYHIDVLSHSSVWARNTKTIAWIPDFQHKHLPEMFTSFELWRRDKFYNEVADKADSVLLSSEEAKKDFIHYYPHGAAKAKVYQFVVPVELVQYDAEELRKRYGIKGKFYYVPNQFWQHKNHRIIVEALKYLRENGNLEITVVCSGGSNDYRNRKYFDELMSIVSTYGLTEQFKVLGKISYCDVQALMQECHALLNPSLFEGWSTMVEEAKSLGKAIILSDLDVHKEQNPICGTFFKRNNCQDLADKMVEIWNMSKEKMNVYDVAKNLQYREREAICNYREILETTLKNK